MTEAPCVDATCSADSFTSTGELHERLYVPHKHSNPEPTEHGGEPPGHEESHPEHGDPELDREQNQPQEQDPTLFPAGQAGAMEAWLGSSTLSPFLTAERTRARAASSRRSSKASRPSGSRPC